MTANKYDTKGAIVPASKDPNYLDPAVYETVTDVATVEEPGQKKTPWVGFYGKKTKSGLDALKTAGIAENQFYLYDMEPLKVSPFQFHLLKYRRFYTQVDDDGKVTGCILTKPTDAQYNEGFREYIMAQVVVCTKDPLGKTILIPATWGARSGLAKVFKDPISLLAQGGAANDANKWGARSTNHKIAAQAKWPGGRFVITAWGSEETPSGGGKNKYNLGHSTISPTSADGVVAFNELASGANLQIYLAPANAAWTFRCKKLEEIATGKK